MMRRISLFPIKIYAVLFKSFPKFSLLICVVFQIIFPTQSLSVSEPSQFKLFNGRVIVDLELIPSNKLQANFSYLGPSSGIANPTITLNISLLSDYRTSASNISNYNDLVIWDVRFFKKVSHKMLVPEMKKPNCDASEIYINISWPGSIRESIFFILANSSFRMLSTFSVEAFNGVNEVKYY